MKLDLRPYDAVLLVSYGGPRQMEDVLPFMRNATKGRGVPDERLLQVSGHYRMFGGASPINERNQELLEKLRAGIAETGLPMVIGNRNWTPFIKDALAQLYQGGARRILCVFTSAYACYSGCRQYREDLAAAVAEIGATDLVIDKIRPFATTEGFIEANAKAIAFAYEKLQAESGLVPHVTLVTHSIPVAMYEGSGSTEIPDYVLQHRHVGTEVLRRVSQKVGRPIDLDLAFCSRSGPPRQKWLEPDINDRLEELASAGVKAVIAAPIGFINDHMEVVYDLDTEAKQSAQELGLAYARAATAGTDQGFIDALLELMNQRAAQARGEAINVTDPVGPWHHEECAPGVCVASASDPVLPSVCEKI